MYDEIIPMIEPDAPTEILLLNNVENKTPPMPFKTFKNFT